MKKHLRHRKSSSESGPKRALRLSQETIKVLTSNQLSDAVSGCYTTTWSTQSEDGPTAVCA